MKEKMQLIRLTFFMLKETPRNKVRLESESSIFERLNLGVRRCIYVNKVSDIIQYVFLYITDPEI